MGYRMMSDRSKQHWRADTNILDVVALMRSQTWSHMYTAIRCDEARKLLLKGNYQAVIEVVLPLAQAKGSPLYERAKQLAIMALDELADDYYERGDYPNAVKCLEQWLALEPHALYPLIRKAEILWLDMENAEEARQVYRIALHHYPRCVEAWLGLADIALFIGHIKRASIFLKKAWIALEDPSWAYPPTAEIVANILESLYVLTARLLAKTGNLQGAYQLLSDGTEAIGDVSEYIRQEIEIIEGLLEQSI